MDDNLKFDGDDIDIDFIHASDFFAIADCWLHTAFQFESTEKIMKNEVYLKLAIKVEEIPQMAPSRYNTLGCYISGTGLSESSEVVALVTCQSGDLEI